MGPTNFFESNFEGYFFKIRDRHRTAFFLTFMEFLFVKATSIIVSDIELTRTSGTIVPIMENAKDCDG